MQGIEFGFASDNRRRRCGTRDDAEILEVLDHDLGGPHIHEFFVPKTVQRAIHSLAGGGNHIRHLGIREPQPDSHGPVGLGSTETVT